MPGIITHGGFDAAATLNSDFVETIVGAYYDTGALPIRQVVSYYVAKNGILPNPPDVPEDQRHPVDLDLRLRRPKAGIGRPYQFTHPQTGDLVTQDMVDIDLELVGTARVRRDGVTSGPTTETLDYRLTLFVQVPLVSQRDAGRLMLPLRFDQLRMRKRRKVEIGPCEGCDWVARASLGDEAVLAVEAQLRLIEQMDITPGFLNDIDAEPVDPGLSVRTAGNVLVLGIDGFSIGSGPVSRGVPEQRIPFLTQGSIAVAVNPAHIDRQLAEGLADLRAEQNQLVADLLSNYRVDRLSHALREGYVVLSGKVTDLRRKIRRRNGELKVVENEANRSVEFSLRAALGVDREAGRIVTDVSHVGLSLDLPWYEQMFVPSLMTMLIASGLYTRLLGLAGDVVGEEIDEALAGFGIYELQIGTEKRQVVKLAYRDASMGTDGAVAMADLSQPRVKLKLEPDGPLGEFFISQRKKLRMRARIVQGYVAEDDPDLAIEWEVMRLARDNIWNDWSPVLPALKKVRAHWNGKDNILLPVALPDGVQGFRVRAVLVRGTGAEREVLGEGETILPTVDRLDRTKPMVAWSYIFHEPRVHRFPSSNGGMAVVDYSRRKKRYSKIHMTAYPGRCKHADRYSQRRSLKLYYLDEYNLWPRDLPRSERKLEMIKDQLCPYCFFGGPASEDLRVAPAFLGL